MSVKYDANSIARWFIYRANNQEETDLSNLKLQKLLYYSQGHHLAQFSTPLFEDEIQAWSHGPVTPAVYHVYKSTGCEPLSVDPFDSKPAIDEETNDFLEQVWTTFGSFSAWKLREMTHAEKPWLSSFRNGELNIEISRDSMQQYFRSLYSV